MITVPTYPTFKPEGADEFYGEELWKLGRNKNSTRLYSTRNRDPKDLVNVLDILVCTVYF